MNTDVCTMKCMSARKIFALSTDMSDNGGGGGLKGNVR